MCNCKPNTTLINLVRNNPTKLSNLSIDALHLLCRRFHLSVVGDRITIENRINTYINLAP